MIKKNELVILLSERAGVPKKYVKPIINVFGQVIIDILASGEGVILTDLGRLSVVDKKVHNGFHAIKKEVIVIPAHKSAKFKPSKMLKEALNPLDNQ